MIVILLFLGILAIMFYELSKQSSHGPDVLGKDDGTIDEPYEW